MSVPVITTLFPNTAGKQIPLPVNIIGSGFFAGSAAFNVTSVSIGGVAVVVQPGGTDTSFSVLSPVVVNTGSYGVIVTTSSGASVGGPLFTYTEFPEGQDRSIDYQTASFWCYGCPFLAIKNSPRPMIGSSSFDSIEPRYANPTKTHYWCDSPNVNFKQRYTQEMSRIGVGFCPYAEQKFQTLYNVAESF
jgi:hypothetical protein